MAAALEVDGRKYELRDEGPNRMRVYIDGQRSERFFIQFEGHRTKSVRGHIGRPPEAMQLDYLRQLHGNLQGSAA